MKHCSYCGKEYAGEVVVCPLDGRPVLEKGGNPSTPAPPPPDARKSFAVKLISPLSRFGTYRVFIERKDLLFIQIEAGSKSALAALAPLLGPAGGLVHLMMWLSNRRQAKKDDPESDAKNAEILLRQSEANFKLFLAEIRDAAIEPRSLLATSGNSGRLTLTVRHGERMKFEFATDEDTSTAIQLLTALLGATLRIKVEWNGEKQRFQAKKIV